jgi:galactose mutarotase-like enzyme
MSELITISKGDITAVVSTLGAELQSLKRGDAEYLWQGDAEFWGGRSPLLFPNTGRVWDNRYRHNGEEYTINIHGFARHMEFQPVEVATSKVTLGIRSTEETKREYPFDFFLFVTYEVLADGLSVNLFVRNESAEDMHFQIGAHPAFFLPDFDAEAPVRGYFGFDTDSKPLHYLIPIEKGCVKPEEQHQLELDGEEMMPIIAKTFDVDTYVIDSTSIRSCTLYDRQRRAYLTVHFDMPILALWAPTLKKPNCPFVCIEPWCGSCDTVGYEGELTDRRVINHLAPSAHFLRTYRIQLH